MTTDATTPGPTREVVFPDVHMHLHTPASTAEGTVVWNERCTAGKSHSFVRHVVFDVSGSKLAGNFRAGQSFGVIPPGLDSTGRPHKLRLYSIASAGSGEDGHGAHLATTVKRTIDEHRETHRLFVGVASNYLADLQVGEKVAMTGPNGKRFLLPARPEAHDYLFIATGTGIAPFRGMLRELDAAGFPGRAALLMGVPHGPDLLYESEWRSLAARHTGFLYLPTLSRQAQEIDASGPMYVDQRLLTHREQLVSMLSSERTLVYICGIAGMELSVLRRMAAVLPAGVREQYMHVEPAAGDPGGWTRRMLHREVKITRRVMLEVY